VVVVASDRLGGRRREKEKSKKKRKIGKRKMSWLDYGITPENKETTFFYSLI